MIFGMIELRVLFIRQPHEVVSVKKVSGCLLQVANARPLASRNIIYNRQGF